MTLRIACLFATGLSALVLTGGAFAQTQTEKQPRWVVGFAPGGGGNVIARIVANKITAMSGPRIIIENRPGATGTVAAAAVATAEPDGLTLLIGATSTNAIAPNVYKNLSYNNTTDLVPVTLLASFPHIISVSPNQDIKSLKDLIGLAKDKPGMLTFSSAGNGSTPHIAGEMFKLATGTNLLHIPYKGAAQAIPDLLTGRVNISFDSTGTIVNQVKDGQMRGLAIAASKRFPLLPNIPTATEAGVAGFEMSTWIGVFAPKGTPPDIVNKVHAEIEKALNQQDLKDQFLNQFGCDDTATHTPREFVEIVEKDTAKYAKIVKDLGISFE